MKIYLVQHGDAVSKQDDPDRPLSKKGSDDVMQVGASLRRADVVIERVVHSGKTRARQTAEILADSVARKPNGTVVPEALDGLAPNDAVEPWADKANTSGKWADHSMLVGHMPFMGKLAATLVNVDAKSDVVLFRPGTVVCLESDPSEGWSVAWMILPEFV